MALQETSGDALTVEFFNGKNLNDFLTSLGDSDISNIIDSITFDVKSQKIIIHMQKLLEEEAQKIERKRTSEPKEYSAEAKIRRLSETYKDKYPELLARFKEWKPCREKLIGILRNAAHSLRRNSTCVSFFRIGTSLADIYGTLTSIDERFASSWSEFAMEHASLFGIAALLIEKVLCEKTLKNVKKSFNEDKELFENIIQWFQQTKELDAAIQSFFPYGIDSEIVQKIERCSPNIGDYTKIFISILAPNVKQNVDLFKNKEFLDKAECVATSEAGRQWLHKRILEIDPYLNHCLNNDLCSEIQGLLDSSRKEFSPTKDPRAYVDAIRLRKNKAYEKVCINIGTIITEINNISDSPEVLDQLEKLAVTVEKQVREMKKAVKLLAPSGMEEDNIFK